MCLVLNIIVECRGEESSSELWQKYPHSHSLRNRYLFPKNNKISTISIYDICRRKKKVNVKWWNGSRSDPWYLDSSEMFFGGIWWDKCALINVTPKQTLLISTCTLYIQFWGSMKTVIYIFNQVKPHRLCSKSIHKLTTKNTARSSS